MKSQHGQDETTAVKQAIVEIRSLRTRLEECERRGSEPIAIVGIGCRYPGGIDGPDAFWRVLHEGVDAVSEVPPDRWNVDEFYDPDPDAPGKMSTRWGGFVSNVDAFDPEFFGISPREAVSMDPQQRLLLEVCWEALEHAGLAPEAHFGTATGVFVGIGSFDYPHILLQPGAAARIDAYLATGVSHSAASGRVSYVLGFRGPSMSVDTACSSSLVSVHLATQSLRARECDLALAGGVNVILTPEVLINLSKARMMASDGRCKAFDAAADGFVRSEGCGVVVLKRLSQALADGNRVLAVVRGTSVNQDGRSSGLTAPNGPSQQLVIRQALENARVEPSRIEYVEAHGTGTSLGDPIEVQALAAVLGENRPADRPLKIGSVKTNLGHSEAAAGVAGLIKVVLAMQQREIPPHLHLRELSPHIPWASMNVDVPVQPTAWIRRDGQPRVAGVSSFGFSGTNAHVVLEDAPETEPEAASVDRPRHVLTLSARNEAALREMARRMADRLDCAGDPFADVAFTANAGRSHFAHRAAFNVATAEEARDALRAFASATITSGVRVGRFDAPAPPEPVFLFTGQGAQYAGMGRELFETQPTFRGAIERCDEVLREAFDVPLKTVLFDREAAALLNQTRFTQPALFSLQYALATLWQSWGVEPIAVMGHSIGEFAAACVAGVFSLEDGLTLAAERGRLMQRLCLPGTMAVAFTSESRLRALTEGLDVTVAALNGDANTVISGADASVRAAIEALARSGVTCRPLTVSHAFHSPLMDPMLDEFERVASRIEFRAPSVPLVSNLTGALFGPSEKPDAKYWRRHAREAVRFAAGVRGLWSLGRRCFVEIGPGHTLLGMARQGMPDGEGTWLPSLRPGQSEWSQMLDTVSALYVEGARVDWTGFDKDYRRRRVSLPTYPFQRKRYWVDEHERAAAPSTPEQRWSDAVAAASRQAAQVPMDLQLHTYEDKWACLDRLVPALMTRALREIGAFANAGDVHSPSDLVARFGVQPTYEHLMGRWLARLEREGLVSACPEGWRADAPLPQPDVDTLASAAERALADIPFLYEYLTRCGTLLSSVLTGKESPLETLFPGGSPETALNLYHRWALSRYYNAISRSAVEALARTVVPRRKLRVLEVGAGTGGTTAALLPVLPPDRTTYVYTDLSEFFFEQAARQFSAYPFLRCQRLNIEEPPQKQGFGYHEFDLVVAANVLHATRDLGETIDHVLSVLRPNGVLLLYEVTNPESWADVSIALIEGWQRFDDGLREDGPLLPLEKWQGLLQARGFTEVIALPEPGSPAEVLASHVMLARAPGVGVESAADAAVISDDVLGAPARSTAAEDDGRAAALAREIVEALPDEREELLTEYVRHCVTQVLRRDTSSPIGRHERLMDLGVDSLMAVELRNLLGTGLRLPGRLPATLMFDYPTVAAIAAYLADQLVGSAPAFVRSGPAAVPSSATQIDDLSDAEVEALLIEKLDRMS